MNLEEEKKIQEKINQIEQIAKKMLSQKSWERYTNIKIADNEKSMTILGAIANAIQKGIEKISDEQFVELLKELEPKKTKIKFMRK
jgi:DNA-binding TFAR19-related protein (PDSD5 family)